MEHRCRIEWPNGRGYTPCSAEYFETKRQRDAICNLQHGETIGALTAHDYEAWSRLDDRLAQLQLGGHTGTSVRY